MVFYHFGVMVATSPAVCHAALTFPRVNRTSVTDQAIEGILDLVRRGVLRSGDRLPPQRQLVTQMRLSQTAVREALKALSTIGVIETHPGHGTFVRSVSPEILVRPEVLFFVLERDTLLHALDIRRILEVEAIALATERATADDLAEMERILRQILEGLNDEKSQFRHSPELHFAIGRATHNPILINLIKPFIGLLVHHAATVGARHPQASEIEYRSHAELYEAILTRDPDKARQTMRTHLEESRRMVLQAFSEHSAENSAEN
jgi:GntR family transcriptional regulator, transcriptional repressor for pyruvate dehydrogenase complex